MNPALLLSIVLATLLVLARVRAQDIDGVDEWNYDDDEEEDGETRNLGAVRDSIKNFVSGTVRYIANAPNLLPKLVPKVVSNALKSKPASSVDDSSGVVPSSTVAPETRPQIFSNAPQTAQSMPVASVVPSPTLISTLAALPSIPLQKLQALGWSLTSAGSAAANRFSASMNHASNMVRNLRVSWAKRNQQQQEELFRRLAKLTRRLTANTKPFMSAVHRTLNARRRSRSRSSKRNSRVSVHRPVIDGHFSAMRPQYVPVPFYYF